MKKLREQKRLVVIASVILLVAIVLLAVLFGGKAKENEKAPNKPKEETQVDNDKFDADKNQDNDLDSQGGLVISDPEEADKEESKDKVEFIRPDGVNDKSDDDNTEDGDNNENGGNTDNDDNTDDDDKESNLNEGTDGTGKYGGFF